jgi:hypothetical protein
MTIRDADEIICYANGDGTFSVELHSWTTKDGEKVPVLMTIPKAEIDITVLATLDNNLWSIAYETHE